MLMLDLFAGLGGASQAMRERGWEVVTVDNDPAFGCTVTADLASWSWDGPTPDLVWASPPCTEFSRESMPWCRSKPAWVPCDCCESHWCNRHGKHAYECPCPPVEEWELSPYVVHPPSLALVEAALRIISECKPAWWVIENVRGATKYLNPLLGEPKQSHGPFFLWGRFPEFGAKVKPFKEKLSSKERARRAKVPKNVSRALAVACESSLFVNEGGDLCGGRADG